jgi:CpeT protein
MKYSLVSLLSLVAMCAACAVQQPVDEEPTPEPFDLVGTLQDYLVGEFDSSSQAQEDYSYFEIQLITCPVDAPELGERVVYVEQASMDNSTAPYRQRLYILEADPETNEARTLVYAMEDPDAAIGLCELDEVATFEADEATERVDCGVELVWDPEAELFDGGTVGEGCSSSLNGASYATSQVQLTGDVIESWDQGWDASDAQVWGATAGAYRFDRR